ncbi:hypothetical protein HK105_207793 [Polyrhizophydium stewartii]|uniref:NADP-dependent oxidoreductase domain-containing protein n=1 Tax=Polyrhizophydium stewartii TaxID=2732419 RepID=A0ABR4MZK5_9FUNG|nr:hypothetical protein HK105_004238 [Polyrhizophydium stewartii]
MSSSTPQPTVPGAATPRATQELRRRFPALPYATVPRTDLAVSHIGIGTYRVRPETEQHREALLAAFRAGVNLVDTSAHFGGGMSELLIGDAIREATTTGILSREELVVASKAGFVMGHPIKKHSGHAEISEGVGHCISPSFLESEISGSLERLGLESLDVFLINCPERMLHAKNTHVSKQQLYDMLGQAFQALENEVARGRIGSYGVASNSMHVPASPEHISIAHILEVATPNMSTIQIPFNLFERDAMMEGYDGAPSLLETCMEKDLFVMVQRPLFSIWHGQVRLLASKPDLRIEDEPQVTAALSDRFQAATQLELELAGLLGSSEADTALVAKFVWAQVLAENLTRLTENGFAAEHYFTKEMIPAIEADLVLLDKHAKEHAQAEGQTILEAWGSSYRDELRALMDSIILMCQMRALQANMDLNGVLTALAPRALDRDAALATNVLRVGLSAMRHVAPASSILVGMRTPDYVARAFSAASQPQLDEATLQALFDSPALQQ